VYCKMFWLDGSSTLPFPIVSQGFSRNLMLNALLLASVENQAKIAKSWVEIGNFNHWCHAASELVDLTKHLIYMDNSLLYYEGLISNNERLHCYSKLNPQLVDLVCFFMFEHVCKCLLANFKFTNSSVPTTLSPSTTNLVTSTHCQIALKWVPK